MRTFAAIMLIAGIVFGAMPASAYTVTPSSGPSNPCNGWGLNDYRATHVVQLCYSGNEAAGLSIFSSYAADVVIQVAKAKGMTINRDKGSIEGEIRAHALAWIANYKRSNANPMDIEMYSAPWWSYILD